MPKTLGIWEWGCQKRGDAQNAVTAVTRNDEIEGLGTRMENLAALAGESCSSFVSWEKNSLFIQQEVEVQAKVR